MCSESRWWCKSYCVGHTAVREQGHGALEMWVRSYDVSHAVWNASHDVNHAALICDWGHMMQVTWVGEGAGWQSDRIVFTHLDRAHKRIWTNTNKQHRTQGRVQYDSEIQHTAGKAHTHTTNKKSNAIQKQEGGGVSYPPFYGASRGLVGCGSSHVAYSMIGC